ncbi:MAG: hypothetical protein U0792_13335 [Gemmataceae bacterium]
MRKWIPTAVAVAALLFASAEQATAGLVPIQVSVTPDAGMYRYTYAVKLPTDAVLRPGDYFTIYDFDGFVPGSATASGSAYSSNWTFSSNPVGPTPAGVGPTDNPSITNLTWTYNGPQIGENSSLGLELLGLVAIPDHQRLVVHGQHRHHERHHRQQHHPDDGAGSFGTAAWSSGTGHLASGGPRASVCCDPSPSQDGDWLMSFGN